MTRKQKKQKRLRARKKNQATAAATRWERIVGERWMAMCILGFIGVVVMGWITRGLGLGFPERPAVLALGWLLAAGVSMFLPVRVS